MSGFLIGWLLGAFLAYGWHDYHSGLRPFQRNYQEIR